MYLLTVPWFWPGLHRQEVGQLDKIKVRSQVCADFWNLYFDPRFGRGFLFGLLPLHPILCILEEGKERKRKRTFQKQHCMIQWPAIIGISAERLSGRLWGKEIWELFIKKDLAQLKEAWWSVEERDGEREERQIPGAVPGSEASLHRCRKRCRQPLQTGRLLLLPSYLWNSMEEGLLWSTHVQWKCQI